MSGSEGAPSPIDMTEQVHVVIPSPPQVSDALHQVLKTFLCFNIANALNLCKHICDFTTYCCYQLLEISKSCGINHLCSSIN